MEKKIERIQILQNGIFARKKIFLSIFKRKEAQILNINLNFDVPVRSPRRHSTECV